MLMTSIEIAASHMQAQCRNAKSSTGGVDRHRRQNAVVLKRNRRPVVFHMATGRWYEDRTLRGEFFSPALLAPGFAAGREGVQETPAFSCAHTLWPVVVRRRPPPCHSSQLSAT